MGKTKKRISKSAAHRQAVAARNFRIAYTREVETHSAALLRFIDWYLRVEELLEAKPVHNSYVKTVGHVDCDYPTPTQINLLSAKEEADRVMWKFICSKM